MSQRLGLYVAHLLGKSKKDRITIFNDMKVLYNIRSLIVHQGTYRVEEGDLKRIKNYTSSVIKRILLNTRTFNQIKTTEELNEYLKSLLL